MLYIIQATICHTSRASDPRATFDATATDPTWTRTSQVPSFVIDSDVSGCLSVDGAREVAMGVFIAAGLSGRDEVHMDVAEYARAETPTLALAERVRSVIPGASLREVPDGLQVGAFSCPPVVAQRMLREAGLIVRDHYGATIVSE